MLAWCAPGLHPAVHAKYGVILFVTENTIFGLNFAVTGFENKDAAELMTSGTGCLKIKICSQDTHVLNCWLKTRM
jgi:hypothetical protein